MVKRVSFVIVFVLCILLIAFLTYKIFTVENGVLYTQQQVDYNTDKYPITEPIFLDKIPVNARVASFSYYNYWDEARDIYLEIKFDTEEEFNAYLSDLTEKYLKAMEGISPPSNCEWLVKMQNPYNENFVDLFCTAFVSYSENKIFTGYRIVLDDDECRYDCNFGVISYSYEELTIVQSLTTGYFCNSIHKYTPQYFVRFSVPFNETTERLIYIEK